MSVAKGSINRANSIRKRNSNDPISSEKTENVAQAIEQLTEGEKSAVGNQANKEKNLSIQVTQELPNYLL